MVNIEIELTNIKDNDTNFVSLFRIILYEINNNLSLINSKRIEILKGKMQKKRYL